MALKILLLNFSYAIIFCHNCDCVFLLFTTLKEANNKEAWRLTLHEYAARADA